MASVRAAAVGYLNARPLFEPLEADPMVRLELARPSVVAERLARGEVDLGLVPVIELLRQPSLSIVSDAAIACDGPVDSVLLLLKTSPDKVQRLALDAASRTSQVLARIVIEEFYGARPEVRELEAQAAWDGDWADAVLVIGDHALEMRAAGCPYLDLGAAWRDHTQRAFVFAVWAGRPGLVEDFPGIADHLVAARTAGLTRRAAMAERAAEGSRLSSEELRVYLTDRIRYRLAAREREGLALFLEKARPLLASMPER